MSGLFVAQRREIKYLVEKDQLEALDKALHPMITYDHNNPDNQGYYNYTIYFDSRLSTFWKEKEEGLSLRVKPRLRVYKSQVDANPTAYFLEFKHREDQFIAKERTQLSPELAKMLLGGGAPSDEELVSSVVLRKFIYMRYRYGLEPKVCVLYHRFAYELPMHHRLRITYDRCLQCSRAISFDTPPEGFAYVEPPSRSILEIKYNQVVPYWLANLIERSELNQTSYSKYGSSRERICVLSRC